MSEMLPITEADARFDSLVRRTSNARERITITDHGQAVAIFINPAELAELEQRIADLEDDLAQARYRTGQWPGSGGIPPEPGHSPAPPSGSAPAPP